MKSNEEYLDDLLKSMDENEDAESGKTDNGPMSPEEIEAMFAMAEDAVSDEPAVEIAELLGEEPIAEMEELLSEEPIAEMEELLSEEPIAEIEELLNEEPIAEIEELLSEEPIAEMEELLSEEPIAEMEELLSEEPIAEIEELLSSEPVKEINDAEAEEALKILEDIDGLEALDISDNLDGTEDLTGLDNLDGLEDLAGLDNLDGTEALAGLDNLDGLEALAGLDNLDGLEDLSGLDNLDSTEDLAGLDDLVGLDDLSGLEDVQIAEPPTVEGTQDMTEDDIEKLLATSSLTDDGLLSEIEVEATENQSVEVANDDDLLALLGSLDDGDLSEIGDLLEKSDNNEAVDASVFAEPENTEAGVDDLLALFSDDVADVPALETEPSEEDGGKKKKKEKKEKTPKEKKPKKEKVKKEKKGKNKEASAENQAADGAKKEKSSGLFAKMFSALTEEDEEELKDDNPSIIAALEEEDKAAAGKKKKMKKGKMPASGKKGKGAEGEGEEEGDDKGKNAKGKKKAKPKKEPKPKKEKAPKVVEADEKPSKRISKKSIFVVVLFAATVFGVVLFVSIFLAGKMKMQRIEDAFAKRDYMTCYTDMYGMKLSEEEEEMFKHAELVLSTQRRISVYGQYAEDDNHLFALDELMQAVAEYDEVYGRAQECDAAGEIAALYDQIWLILSENYGLSQEDARTIALCDSNVDYTRYLIALTGGDVSGGNGSIDLPEEEMQDILPEEEELITPDFAN